MASRSGHEGCGQWWCPVRRLRHSIPAALSMALAGFGRDRLCWVCRRGWDDDAADRFVAAVHATFPGTVELDENGEPLAPKQLSFDSDYPKEEVHGKHR